MHGNGFFIAMALILAACGSLEAQADGVERSRTGHGGALILPIWSVGVGANSADEPTTTLLNVTNHANVPSAVKIRVIGRLGAELAAFNVYLDGLDTFAAALAADAGGQGSLLTRDGSCVVPGFEATGGGTVGRLAFSGTAAGGYIEIIDTGRAAPDSGLTRDSEVFLSEVIRWIDCPTLVARFDDAWQADPGEGLLPPAGALSADVQLVDVFSGANASVSATAIAGFSDIVQHTAPDAAGPTLATAHTAGTEAGVTVSRVCDAGACRDFEWDRPVDAVASVLTVQSLRGDVTVNPGIGADTEMVLVSPLARFDAENEPVAAADTVLRLRDRDGVLLWSELETVELSPPPPKPDPIALPVTGAGETIQIIPFGAEVGDIDLPADSRLLGLPVAGSVALGDNGAATVTAARAEVQFVQSPEQPLTSLGGHVFAGLPVIGLMIRQYTNGTLASPVDPGQQVLTNYRVTEPMTTSRTVQEPSS